jgi:hypothetical protein
MGLFTLGFWSEPGGINTETKREDYGDEAPRCRGRRF